MGLAWAVIGFWCEADPVRAQPVDATGFPIYAQKPPDVQLDRMERDPKIRRPELTQADVVHLAKAAATQEMGKAFDDYELKTVLFDASGREWSVAFELKPPKRESNSCLYVTVVDATKVTTVRRCS